MVGLRWELPSFFYGSIVALAPWRQRSLGRIGIMLLSPMLGSAYAALVDISLYRPRADRLSEAVKAQCSPTLRQAEIHVGSEDW